MMNFDAIGNTITVGDWLLCVRSCRTTFTFFPGKVTEICEKSFKVYCGKTTKYNHSKSQMEEVDDVRILHIMRNTIKIFPENLPKDVCARWKAKLEPE